MTEEELNFVYTIANNHKIPILPSYQRSLLVGIFLHGKTFYKVEDFLKYCIANDYINEEEAVMYRLSI